MRQAEVCLMCFKVLLGFSLGSCKDISTQRGYAGNVANLRDRHLCNKVDHHEIIPALKNYSLCEWSNNEPTDKIQNRTTNSRFDH